MVSFLTKKMKSKKNPKIAFFGPMETVHCSENFTKGRAKIHRHLEVKISVISPLYPEKLNFKTGAQKCDLSPLKSVYYTMIIKKTYILFGGQVQLYQD